MLSNEALNLLDKGSVLHGPHLSRVITRMSTWNECNYTILRGNSRTPISGDMETPTIDMAKLKAAMARQVEATSARSFSLLATGGKNPDFYRNFVNNGQDKRLTAELFLGIVQALGSSPSDYIDGARSDRVLPSEAVLTATFVVMLGALGVDPNEDGRAHKLAAHFPDTLRQIEALHANAATASEPVRSEGAPAPEEDQPTS